MVRKFISVYHAFLSVSKNFHVGKRFVIKTSIFYPSINMMTYSTHFQFRSILFCFSYKLFVSVFQRILIERGKFIKAAKTFHCRLIAIIAIKLNASHIRMFFTESFAIFISKVFTISPLIPHHIGI